MSICYYLLLLHSLHLPTYIYIYIFICCVLCSRINLSCKSRNAEHFTAASYRCKCATEENSPPDGMEGVSTKKKGWEGGKAIWNMVLFFFFFFSLDELQMRAVEDLSITMSDRTPESHSCPQTTQRRKRRKRVSLLGIETPTSRRNRRVNTHSHYVWSNWRQPRLKRNISCIWRTLNIIVYRASCCSNHHDAFAINPLVEVAI